MWFTRNFHVYRPTPCQHGACRRRTIQHPHLTITGGSGADRLSDSPEIIVAASGRASWNPATEAMAPQTDLSVHWVLSSHLSVSLRLCPLWWEGGYGLRHSQIRVPPLWAGETGKIHPPPPADGRFRERRLPSACTSSSPERFGLAEGGSGDESGREGRAQP